MEKELIIKYIYNLGLYVDHDQWDVENKGWIRVKLTGFESGHSNTNCCILYKIDMNDDSWVDGYDYLGSQLSGFLFNCGKIKNKQELKGFLGI